MNRRELLASGAALLASGVAGCTGLIGRDGTMGAAEVPTASLRMETIADAEIAERVTYGATLDSGVRDGSLASALPDGSTTVEATRPPVPESKPFVRDGAVYEFSHEVVDSTPATSFQILIDPADGEVPEDETVAYEDLPAVDRAVFERRGWNDPGFLGFGTSVLYLDDQIPDSALVPEPEYSVVVWNADTRGRFEVHGSHDTELNTYEYTAEVVDESAAAFGAEVREEYEFELSSLSEAEREIVSEAIESDGYGVPADEPLSDPMRRLAERFRQQDDVGWVWEDEADDEDGGDGASVAGRFLARYEGTVYWTQIHASPNSTETGTPETGSGSRTPTEAGTDTSTE